MWVVPAKMEPTTTSFLRNKYWVLRHGKSIPNERGLIVSSLVSFFLSFFNFLMAIFVSFFSFFFFQLFFLIPCWDCTDRKMVRAQIMNWPPKA